MSFQDKLCRSIGFRRVKKGIDPTGPEGESHGSEKDDVFEKI